MLIATNKSNKVEECVKDTEQLTINSDSSYEQERLTSGP